MTVSVARWQWWLLIAFIMALLLFDLGGRGLNEPDEGRYAEIAREGLLPDHPWWDPHLAGIGHYDKPPLIYWVAALSFRAFGLNEWAARVPCLLGMLLTLAGVGWMAARRYDQRIAFLAVLVAGTTAHLWLMARILSTDMLLTGWITLAVAAWAETRARGGAWGWWLQVLFWTLALWTKATPALIPMLGLSLWIYFFGDAQDRRALRLPLLLPLALVLASPWFLFMAHVHPELKAFYLGREVESRIAGHIGGRAAQVYYYAVTTLAAWLPWWPLALAMGWRRLRLEGESWREQVRRWGPEAAIVVTGFIVFSLIPSKQHTYTLPLAPWVALLMARALAPVSGRVLGGVAGAVGALYLTLALVMALPKYQVDLGRNSSVAPVVNFLRTHGAQGLESDRFYAGLLFYGGGDVHFIDVIAPVEISGETTTHFNSFSSVPFRTQDWFLHYRGQSETPFAGWLKDPHVEKFTLGDFVVGRVPQKE
jgi:4-amino-4-deoxy-L-arabinose transferase-like glycosyltransferase